MSPDAKKLGLFVRGFMRACPLPPRGLLEVLLFLAIEQAEKAAGEKGLTIETWLEAATIAYQKSRR